MMVGCLAEPPAPAGDTVNAPAELAELRIGDAVRIDAQQAAREPAIEEAPDGTLYVAAFWGQYRFPEHLPGSSQNALSVPLVWKSTDGGKQWSRVNPGLPLQGALGNSDVDLAVDSRGTVYLASTVYWRQGTTLFLGATQDGGASWRWSLLDRGPSAFRPWLDVGPDDRPRVVWGHRGIHQAYSSDRGATWTEGALVYPRGSPGGFDVGPEGNLAVRVIPLEGVSALDSAVVREADGVAVSRDDGATWRFQKLPGNRSWADTAGQGGDGVPRAFDPIVFDARGDLYALWTEPTTVHVAQTGDLGETWSEVALVPEAGMPYYPYMIAGPGPGELAATWFTNTNGTVAARLAHFLDAQAIAPAVRVTSFEADTGGPDHAEYFQLASLQGGGFGAPVPVTRTGGQWLDYRVAR